MVRLAALCLAAVVALLAGSVPATAADPVEVNVIISTTGQGAFLGKELQKSLELIEGIANKTGGIRGRPLKFVYYDDQTNPQNDVQLFNQMVEKRAAVVIGPSFTAPCLAGVPIVQANGPVELCLSPALHPTHGSNIFSIGASIADDIAVYFRYFRLNGWNKIGLITSADATGQDVERAVAAALARPENKNMTLVESNRFALADINVSAQMARLKASGAEAIIAWTTGTPLGTILHGINDVGIQVPIATSPGNMTFAQMEQFASILPPRLVFAGLNGIVRGAARPGPMAEAQKVYFNALDAAGVRADYGYLIPWDISMIVIEALRKLGPDATAPQIRNYILGLHGWTGIEGTYDFSDREQRGVGETALSIVSWDTQKKDWIVKSRPGGYLK